MPAVTFTTGGALKKSALRQANERLVLNVIRKSPAVSRADIVRLTGLAPSSVTFIVKRLKREKLIVEEKVDNYSQVGRQPTALRLRPGAKVAAGVDVTLTGARILLADLSDNVLASDEVPWHPDERIFFQRVNAGLHALLDPLPSSRILGAGVSLPGFIDRATGRVIGAENFNWFDVEAGSLLRHGIEAPFYFENGAKLSALAEMWFPNDCGPLSDFISVSARGGLGTGVIIGGQVLQGADSAASEFGHIPINPEGPRCPCGNTGCWEQYASDLALCRAYAEAAGVAADSVTAEAVVRGARAGDAVSLEVLHKTARYVGIGFVNLIMALNPQAIIVNDYLAEAWDLIKDVVWDAIRGRMAGYYLRTVRICPSRHGSDASLMGTVAMVFSHFFSSFDHGTEAVPANAVLIREH
ncbi:MAG: ROK family protein [Acidobacteriota bacterium]